MTVLRIRTLTVVGLVLAVGTLLVSAQPVPNYPAMAPGTMPIEGTVSILNTPNVNVVNSPSVSARQDGAWTVRLNGLAVPSFLEVGKAYLFTWPSGRTDSYRVVDVREDGWARVDATGPDSTKTTRWVNPAMAAVIEMKN